MLKPSITIAFKFICQGGFPIEILASGEEAELAYKKAMETEAVKMYHGRIMIIGPARAGKTSLKNSLLGLPFNSEEQSTSGVIVEHSKVVDVENWRLIDEDVSMSPPDS